MKRTLGVLGFAGLGLLTGCGSSDPGSPNMGGAGSSAAAGSSGAGSGGASSQGGTSSQGGASSQAGASQAGGSSQGGASSGQKHCSPGVTMPAINSFPYPVSNCGFTGKGALAGKDGFFDNIALEAPLAPGQTYAFSVDMKSADGTMELWGTSSACGDAVELLATAQAGEGIRCMTASPKQGTYSNLIWAIYAGGTNGDMTFCPNGSCGQ